LTTSAPTFYDILGVGPVADPETIRRAYRRLAQKHHPDVSDSPDAHENMARINEAFETLTDKNRREEYDALLAGGSQEPEHATPQTPVMVRLIKRLHGHKTPVYALAFAPDSGQLMSVGFDNELIWWAEEGETTRQTKLESGAVSTLRAFSGGRVMAAGSTESHVNVWRLDGEEVKNWRGVQEEWVSCVAISGDGSSIAAGSVHAQLRVCDSATGAAMYTLRSADASVTAVAFSADGRLLAGGTADARVTIREAKTGRWVRTIERLRSMVTAIAFSADSEYLAVAGVDLSIRVFELSTGNLLKMVYGHSKPIEALAFHPNGWLFASGSRDGTIGLWNAAKGIGSVRIEASSRPISCVAFNSDGSRLAASGQDKLVRLFEITAKS
jgi:WD40 repeat protein